LDCGVGRMKLIELNSESLKKVSNKELISLHRRIHQLYFLEKRKNKDTKQLKIYHDLILNEIKNRKLNHKSNLESTMLINNYLNELFGIGAPSGEEVVEHITNKMNDELSKAYKSCDKEKDENKKQICIKENILKIKKETRSELVRSYSKCEGRRPCHREISYMIARIDKELSELNSEISKLKRNK
jgi:hypothetical protein